jgi:glycosyltransferase involved in cell wall biosynthesis
MIRVLHLLNTDADFQSRRTVQSLRGSLGPDFQLDIASLGDRGDFRNVPAAVLGLHKRTFDVVHTWSIPALTAAAVAGGRRIVFSPNRFAGPKSVRWVRSAMAYRDVQMLCTTATQQRLAVERGVPIEQCHLIRPGVEFGRIHRRRDDALRAGLGFSADDFVLLAPGESTRAAAHDEAVWACGILNVLDRRYKLLIWGRGPRARNAAMLGERLHQSEMVKVAQPSLGGCVEFEQLLPAADAVLITAKAPVATLPIAICMAAGLPIVTTVTYTVAELLEDHHTALMVPRASPRLLAQRVLDLRADSALQWSIADMARTEAYEFFSHTRMIEQYRAVYRQMADGKTVAVPQPAAGAGLRFHGRG